MKKFYLGLAIFVLILGAGILLKYTVGGNITGDVLLATAIFVAIIVVVLSEIWE